MNEHQAMQVRNFLQVLFGEKLLNCWIEPSDFSHGWAVFFNFNTREDCYIRTVAEMQAPNFWEKLLTKANETV